MREVPRCGLVKPSDGLQKRILIVHEKLNRNRQFLGIYLNVNISPILRIAIAYANLSGIASAIISSLLNLIFIILGNHYLVGVNI